jgi:hypothetical protein
METQNKRGSWRFGKVVGMVLYSDKERFQNNKRNTTTVFRRFTYRLNNCFLQF